MYSADPRQPIKVDPVIFGIRLLQSYIPLVQRGISTEIVYLKFREELGILVACLFSAGTEEHTLFTETGKYAEGISQDLVNEKIDSVIKAIWEQIGKESQNTEVARFHLHGKSR